MIYRALLLREEKLLPLTCCLSLSCLFHSVSSAHRASRNLLACTLEEMKSKAMKQGLKESRGEKGKKWKWKVSSLAFTSTAPAAKGQW